MKPFEILLSESQERMLVVVKKGMEKTVEDIFAKWDIHAVQIGEVTEGPLLEYYFHNELVGQIPAKSLVLGGGAPVYQREIKEPAYYQEYKKFNIDSVPVPNDLKEVARFIVALPNVASKRFVYEQYDSMVGTANMSTNAPSDAAIVNIKGTNKALALSVDCNSRYVNADPEVGTAIAVAEAARNITCSGGEPSAITNCLNFGNPYNPECYWQFVGAIKGMSKACLRFKTPVTGGNVSFYNQTVVNGKETPVFPTPTIGMLGLLEDKAHRMSLNFKSKGDLIFLIGESKNDIASSEYLYHYHKIKASPAPYFNLDEEYEMHQVVKEMIRQGIVESVHDCADGGLFVTLLEKAMPGGFGFDIESDGDIRLDAFLFGEAQGRVVVSVVEAFRDEFIELMSVSAIPFTLLGHVTRGRITVDGEDYGMVGEFKEIYDNAIVREMQEA